MKTFLFQNKNLVSWMLYLFSISFDFFAFWDRVLQCRSGWSWIPGLPIIASLVLEFTSLHYHTQPFQLLVWTVLYLFLHRTFCFVLCNIGGSMYGLMCAKHTLHWTIVTVFSCYFETEFKLPKLAENLLCLPWTFLPPE